MCHVALWNVVYLDFILLYGTSLIPFLSSVQSTVQILSRTTIQIQCIVHGVSVLTVTCVGCHGNPPKSPGPADRPLSLVPSLPASPCTTTCTCAFCLLRVLHTAYLNYTQLGHPLPGSRFTPIDAIHSQLPSLSSLHYGVLYPFPLNLHQTTSGPDQRTV
jgi:hypothetical protein